MTLSTMEPARLLGGQKPFTAVHKLSTRRNGISKRAQAKSGNFAASSAAHKCGSALLSAAFALSVGLTAVAPPPALAEDVYERRRAEMERRKEMLAKTREKALAAGGQETGDGDTPTTSSPAPAVSAAEDKKVQADTAEVLRSNGEREKEAKRMRDSLKNSLTTYEQSAKIDESKLKAGADKTEKTPSWFSNFLEKNKKEDGEAPVPSPTTPAPQSTPAPSTPAPAFNFFQKSDQAAPEVTPPPDLSPKESTPEPASPPLPAFKPTPPPPPPAAKPTPPPAPVTPPAPKPPTKLGVQPVQASLKDQKKVEVKQGKKKGPLPMVVAQILLLAIFGVFGYGTIVKETQTNALLATLGKYIGGAYSKVEGILSKKAKKAV